MGKKEGLSNEIKRRVHDTWLADKVDQQLLGMKPFADSMFLVGPTQFGLKCLLSTCRTFNPSG